VTAGVEAKRIKLKFGRYQVYASEKLRRIPGLRFCIKNIFGYTNISGWTRSRIFIRMLRNLPLKQFHRIMDLGCGQGEYVMMLAEKLPQSHIVALDIAESEINAVKRGNEKVQFQNIEPFTGTVEQYPDTPLFDFIFSIDVFEHMPAEKMPFDECYRRLNPGGYLLVKMPARENISILPKRWFTSHAEWVERAHPGQVFELPDLVESLEGAGFELQNAFYRDGFFSRLAWEIGFLTKKWGSLTQLLFLPLVKLLAMCDGLLPESKYKNTIHVIGRKPQK
jgi:2-polyprenyl-3-methyl-5-hydroxy-6-metoxy-1,4-benzoquinol methylase